MSTIYAIPWLVQTLDTIHETRVWLPSAGVGLLIVWGGVLLNVVVNRQPWPMRLCRWVQEWTLPVVFIVSGTLLLVSGGEWWIPAVDTADILFRRWIFDLQENALTWGNLGPVEEVARPVYVVGDMCTQSGLVVRGCPP
ncbi:Uncharacterised protein [Serratia quinivorans]|nr:Uncharacterised protein [Serratia quinivorans]